MLMYNLQFPLITQAEPGIKKDTVGDRIKRARERLGLNQSELARRVGVRPQAVQQWENGSNFPADRDRYEQIAKVLEVTPYWLEYGGESTPVGFDGEMLEIVLSSVRGAEMELGIQLPAPTHGRIVHDIYAAAMSDFEIRQHAKATIPAFARTLVARAVKHES